MYKKCHSETYCFLLKMLNMFIRKCRSKQQRKSGLRGEKNLILFQFCLCTGGLGSGGDGNSPDQVGMMDRENTWKDNWNLGAFKK